MRPILCNKCGTQCNEQFFVLGFRERENHNFIPTTIKNETVDLCPLCKAILVGYACSSAKE